MFGRIQMNISEEMIYAIQEMPPSDSSITKDKELQVQLNSLLKKEQFI